MTSSNCFSYVKTVAVEPIQNAIKELKETVDAEENTVVDTSVMCDGTPT